MSFDARAEAEYLMRESCICPGDPLFFPVLITDCDGCLAASLDRIHRAAHRAGQREALESLAEWTTARDGWRELRELYPHYAQGAPTEAAWAFGETDCEIRRRLAELEKQA